MRQVMDPRLSKFLEAAGDVAEAQLLGEVNERQVASIIACALITTRCDLALVVEEMFETIKKRNQQIWEKRQAKTAKA